MEPENAREELGRVIYYARQKLTSRSVQKKEQKEESEGMEEEK